MADLPQGAPAPSSDAPPQGQGGGIVEAITAVDNMVAKIAGAIAENDQVPDEVKSAWQDAQASLRNAIQAIAGMGDAKEPDGDEAGGTVTPEQGGGGAVPMTHQNMRG